MTLQQISSIVVFQHGIQVDCDASGTTIGGILSQGVSPLVEFLQSYSFVLKHRSGSSNQMADALSRTCILLNEMRIEDSSFDSMRELYEDDVEC